MRTGQFYKELKLDNALYITEFGDEDYVQQVNQTASQVDSEKFGKFMSDYLAGMAKADYTNKERLKSHNIISGQSIYKKGRKRPFFISKNNGIMVRFWYIEHSNINNEVRNE